MTRDDIFSKISEILHDTFEVPVDQITWETLIMEELDLDSIDAVDLIVKIQSYTDKKVDPQVFKKVRTVGDVVDAVYELVSDQSEQAG